MDAIDVALVKFSTKAELVYYHEYPIEDTLRHQIRGINATSELGHILDLDHQLGYLFADAVGDVLARANVRHQDVIAIGSHGQTILHRPRAQYPTSVQIGDPNIISNVTGIVTVADFRRMDIANHGQGGPLASAFHQYQLYQKDKVIVVLNIGGMANITILSNDVVLGFDTGPGNALLDDWYRQHNSQQYDQNSEWAKEGCVNQDLLTLLLTDDYFALPVPKSTGRDYFNLPWLNAYREKLNTNIAAEAVQATLLQLSVMTIANGIKDNITTVDEVLVCGGGAYNPWLMQQLQNQLNGMALITTEKYGFSPNCIEAVTFAWLAKQRIENKTIDLCSITGADKAVLLGGIYTSN